MTEQDKIIQDLRRDNERLHALVEQYILGVKNFTTENKQLRKENEQLKTTVLILKTQVEELHQQIKRDRLAMSSGFRGVNDGGKQV